VPATDAAVFGDGFFNEAALFGAEYARLFHQKRSGGGLPLWVGGPEPSRPLEPSALIAGEPGAVGRPRQEIREWIGHRDVNRVGIWNTSPKRQRGNGTQARSASEGTSLLIAQRFRDHE
jgi:hypothetical protein